MPRRNSCGRAPNAAGRGLLNVLVTNFWPAPHKMGFIFMKEAPRNHQRKHCLDKLRLNDSTYDIKGTYLTKHLTSQYDNASLCIPTLLRLVGQQKR